MRRDPASRLGSVLSRVYGSRTSRARGACQSSRAFASRARGEVRRVSHEELRRRARAASATGGISTRMLTNRPGPTHTLLVSTRTALRSGELVRARRGASSLSRASARPRASSSPSRARTASPNRVRLRKGAARSPASRAPPRRETSRVRLPRRCAPAGAGPEPTEASRRILSSVSESRGASFSRDAARARRAGVGDSGDLGDAASRGGVSARVSRRSAGGATASFSSSSRFVFA